MFHVRLWLCVSLQMVAWVPALVALAGCQTASTAPDDAVAHQAEPPDELAYDPARAFLRLNEIVPDPPAPRGPEPGAAQLSPEGARRLSRARSLYSERRFSEAATELEKALRQEPDHPVLHREAALAWRAAEEHRRVRPHLTKALEGDGDDIVTHYLLGRLAFEDQQQPDAIGHYRLALKASNAAAHPAFAAACRFHLAKALNAEGYLTAAIEQYRAFEDAVASLPDEARSNREIEALLAINDGRAGKPISVAYEKLGRYEEAADALTDAYRDREPDPGTREHLARLLARTGRYEAALTQARLLARQSDRAIELLIELHEDAGHAELVLEDLGALYAQNPDRQNILIAHADALERFGRLEEAKALLLDAVDREATGPELYWRLIDLFQQTGEPHRALEIATAAVRRFPGVFDTAKAKTTAFAESPDAVASLLGDAQSEPLADSDAVSAALLGVLAERVGRCEQAQRYLEYAVRAEPALKPARIELAELLLQRFQWQAVTDLVTVDEEALRGDARLARLCGEAYAGLDDFENATQQLNAAIRLNRSDVEAMVALAGVYREADQVHQAASQYEKILELNPLHEASREKLIEYYLVDPQGRREDALHQLGELKRLNASPHRIARCEALIERGEGESIEDWRAYRETLERAITEHGPDAETYARIAGSHLSELQFDEASEALDRAVAAEPNNMDALELRVPAYQLTLQYDRAVEHLKGLLRRHPNRNRWIGQLWQVLMNHHRFREA